MFYKLAFFVAVLSGAAFMLLSTKVKIVKAYRSSRSYYSYYQYGYYSYGYTSMAWYIWVVISGVVFGTVVGIIICCICCQRRRMAMRRNQMMTYNNTGVPTVTGPYISGAGPTYIPPTNVNGYQPYPQNPMYPTQPVGTQPAGKMPEPPAYINTTNAPPPSYGMVIGNPTYPTAYTYDNQGAVTSDNVTTTGGTTTGDFATSSPSAPTTDVGSSNTGGGGDM